MSASLGEGEKLSISYTTSLRASFPFSFPSDWLWSGDKRGGFLAGFGRLLLSVVVQVMKRTFEAIVFGKAC